MEEIKYPVEVIEGDMEFIDNDVMIRRITQRTTINSESDLELKAKELALKEKFGSLKSYIVKGIFKGKIYWPIAKAKLTVEK
jgi:hypothetical protein